MDDFLCDGEWDSWINGNSDGFFEFHLNESTGDITGWHYYDDDGSFPIWGICTHPTSPESAHHIDFLEPHGVVAYRFTGVIVPDASGGQRHRIPHGKRRTLRRLRRREMLNDDEWTGEKTT